MTSPIVGEGRVAVITGAAMGIGLAAAKRCAGDIRQAHPHAHAGDELEVAAEQVGTIAPDGDAAVMSAEINVGRAQDLEALCDAVYETFGEVGLLMNNAATRVAGGTSETLEDWHRTMDVNFWGVVHGVRAFLPRMLAQSAPSAIVNTGSKQGITNPPGNVIYNVTKSAVKTYTEQLQHELRNTEGCQISAHLLVPGFTTTGKREHKPGAWLPDQVVERMLAALEAGDFYIICPDNEVTEEMDRKRILWGAGDITENRPPLSRWHPDFAEAFKQSD